MERRLPERAVARPERRAARAAACGAQRLLAAIAGPRAVLAVGIAALGAAAGACGDRTAPSIERLHVAKPPRPEAPLGVRVEVAVNEPVRLAIEIDDGERLDRLELDGEYRTAHGVPLVGLRPGRTHAVTFIATDPAGNHGRAPPLIIETDPLPEDFPPLAVTASRPERMEPGATLLNVYRWGEEGPDNDFGLLVAVDASGDVVWYYRAEHTIAHAIPLANGNLLYMASVDGVWAILVEIDLLGNVARRWHSRALADSAPADSVLVDVDSLHHDLVELPSGNLLALGSEVRTFDDYPTSDDDPAAPRARRDVVGDVIVEIAPDGAVVQRWSLFDVVDPLVKVDRTGAVRWILGPHDGWADPWRGRLLEPQGDLEWAYHSHGVEVTPGGTILLFDNGNNRAMPFDPPLPAEASYSRAVEFEVDAAAMRVRQRWAYPRSEAERFYSSFLGDADWLPETGNVLITDGGRTRTIGTAGGEPEDRRWARILEVTRDDPAETVFVLVIDDDTPTTAGQRSVSPTPASRRPRAPGSPRSRSR